MRATEFLRLPPAAAVRTLRVGVVCDLAEEEWPSMDLVADRLTNTLRADPVCGIHPVTLRPGMPRRVTRLPGLARNPRARMLDRLTARHLDYPRWLTQHRTAFDVFHVVDHSYAHLVLGLPAERTVVTCHDLDTFRCLLQPDAEPRSAAFRALVRRTLDGMRRASRVICVSTAVREEIVAQGLVECRRLRVIHNGVDEVFSPEPDAEADRHIRRVLHDTRDTIDILHVGSVIARKRIDVLLRTMAILSRSDPRVRLVRVGGAMTPAQSALAEQLGIRILSLPFLSARMLAAVYRRAAVCLLTSDREGFGLPVIEALACGVPVVASAIPSLQETGGCAAVYCQPGDPEAFARATAEIIGTAEGSVRAGGRADRPASRHGCGLEHARSFTWAAHAAAVASVYREVA
jgi:glycosyltransferase involved in cell wall biosynthesis